MKIDYYLVLQEDLFYAALLLIPEKYLFYHPKAHLLNNLLLNK